MPSAPTADDKVQQALVDSKVRELAVPTLSAGESYDELLAVEHLIGARA